MKKIAITIISLFLSILFIISSFTVFAQDKVIVENASYQTAIEWLESGIENNNIYSFKYDNVKFSEIANTWIKTVDKSSKDEFVYYNVKYTSPDNVVFTVDFTVDKEYASIEWVGHFYNNASTNSPVIADILPIDTKFDLGETTLTVPQGAQYGCGQFSPESHNLNKGTYSYQSTGRSGDTANPYFDLCDGKQGIVGGLGWAGGFKASYNRKNGLSRVTMGMINTKISLYAGEDMRTPSVLIMFFIGDQDDGHNQFRHLMLKSYTPIDPDTGETYTELPQMLNGGIGGETAIRKEIPMLKRMTALLEWDSLWLDAGYYMNPGDNWTTSVGNFYPTKYADISDGSFLTTSELLKQADLGLCVWFEPERAMTGTTLQVKYPQYYGAGMYENLNVIKLDEEEAYQYIFNLVSDYLIECKIRWYREDLNFTPELYWSSKDKSQGANRDGITEIKYITNKYRFFDELAEKIPTLKFDCLARRYDFEMTRRSTSLFRSDYVWDADGTRTINFSLQYWLPLTMGYSCITHRSTYVWRCQFCAGDAVSYDTIVTTKNFDIFGYNELKDLKEYILGDFYILKQDIGTEEMVKNMAAYQFNSTDRQDGILMVFRPRACAEDTINLKLKGLISSKVYNVEVTDTGDKFQATGYDLMNNGLDITIDNVETSFLIKFN